VEVTGELDFWLAGTGGFFRLLAGADTAERSGLVPPAFSWGAMGLLTQDSFAYLTRRPGQPGRSELGACGYGPARRKLTAACADRIRAFDRDRASAGRLRIEVRPGGHAPVPDSIMRIDKRRTTVIVRTEGE
jgi:protein-L-isoaspartate(D-aspartate) O-methyltransferase